MKKRKYHKKMGNAGNLNKNSNRNTSKTNKFEQKLTKILKIPS